MRSATQHTVNTQRAHSPGITRVARQRAISPARTREAGMTLVELMVASAIFVTVMSGTLLLFNGAISTVRQGYRTMEAFEKARGSLTVMERDLTTAFTARELGQNFQFYGRPNGFTFVGQVDGSSGGGMSRVTYAVNDDAAFGEFRAELTERFGILNARAIAHDLRGDTGGQAALGLAQYLAFIGAVDFGAYPINTQTLVGLRFVETRQGALNGLNAAEAEIINNTIVIVPVIVQTGGLVRYVERGTGSNEGSGISDISTFDAPLDVNGQPLWRWPSINSLRDDLNNPELSPTWYVANYINIGHRGDQDSRGLTELQDTVNSLDLNVARYALDDTLVEELFYARKRDLWVRMIAGDSMDVGVPGIWATRATPGLNVEEYVLSDSIVTRVMPAVEAQPYENQMAGLDLLNINGHYFDYGIVIEEGEAVGDVGDDVYMTPWWNSEENLRNVHELDEALRVPPGPGRDEYLVNFNRALVSQMEGSRPVQAGLFLRPKLPEVVQPRYWIMMENPWLGSAEFKRWFTQLIQVPAGDTRTREESVPLI